MSTVYRLTRRAETRHYWKENEMTETTLPYSMPSKFVLLTETWLLWNDYLEWGGKPRVALGEFKNGIDTIDEYGRAIKSWPDGQVVKIDAADQSIRFWLGAGWIEWRDGKLTVLDGRPAPEVTTPKIGLKEALACGGLEALDDVMAAPAGVEDQFMTAVRDIARGS